MKNVLKKGSRSQERGAILETVRVGGEMDDVLFNVRKRLGEVGGETTAYAI